MTLYKGQCLYYGPIKGLSAGLTANGASCPAEYNLADHVISVIQVRCICMCMWPCACGHVHVAMRMWPCGHAHVAMRTPRIRTHARECNLADHPRDLGVISAVQTSEIEALDKLRDALIAGK